MSTVFSAIQAGNVFSFISDISSTKGTAFDIICLLDSIPKIDVLHDLNLTVEPGNYVMLIGASGCGKSMTIQLIEHFYNLLAGNPLIPFLPFLPPGCVLLISSSLQLDEQPVTKFNVNEYYKQIALISQEPMLYPGTTRFNILLSVVNPVKEVMQKVIEEACCNANILEFVQSLPNGFNTQVGGKGSQLSSG